MGTIKPFHPPEIGDDAHIIRRLGWAVVRQWSNLPESVQEQLQEQAVFVFDSYMTVQLDQQISIFIDKHSE